MENKDDIAQNEDGTTPVADAEATQTDAAEPEATEAVEAAEPASDDAADADVTAEAEPVDEKAAKEAEKAAKKAAKEAEREAKKAAKAKARAEGKSGAKTFGAPVLAGAAAAALVVGVLAGHFVWGSGMGATNSATISESDLDSPVATYTYDGQTETITARQAIEATSTVDSSKNDDGTYDMPSADSVLSCARNKILAKAVEEAGIEVTDDDVSSYAEDTLGTSDISTIASQYGMDEDATETLLKQSAGVKKLYDQTVDTSNLTAPTAPEEDKDAATYGKYIVDLLGDEWDSDKDTWASTDGDYYSALGSEKFTSKSATYDQAQTAYYVAYQKYSTAYSEATSKWTSFVNERLAKASIQIKSLVS